MRTIVVNTSKEAKETRLRLLFSAPFDSSSLLYFNSTLPKIGEVAAQIKQKLITDTDTVDRDYNIIVLVDLYTFPRGNEQDVARLYKYLLEKYIATSFLSKLYRDYGLNPLGVSLYFVDSSSKVSNFDDGRFTAKNPEEQRLEERRKQEAAEQAEQAMLDSDGDSFIGEVDEVHIASPENNQHRSERKHQLMMELFGWNADAKADAIGWKLKCAAGEDGFIDLKETFSATVKEIENSSEGVPVLDLALAVVKDLELGTDIDRFSTFTERDMDVLKGSSVYSLVCRFKRENEQDLVEGFFNVFANIFCCVQNKKLSRGVVNYGKDEIKALLIHALKKYRFYSEEKNLPVEFEVVSLVFEEGDAICRQWSSAQKKPYKANDDKDLLAQISADVQKAYSGDASESSVDKFAEEIVKEESAHKLKGLDRQVYDTVKEILLNYDEELIKRQNRIFLKKCRESVWDWRDKQTEKEFSDVVAAKVAEVASKKTADVKDSVGTIVINEKGKVKKTTRDSIDFIKDENEKKHGDLVAAVTETQHKLASNNNVLVETKNILIKYSDLMKKSKWYRIAFVGAIVAIIIAVLPYIYIQFNSNSENAIHRALYVLFTAGFALLYSAASGIYIGKLSKKKRALKAELDALKEKSVNERRQSIIALYNYYTDIIVRTESHGLLWREILKRDRENARLGIKRNTHIRKLNRLAKTVEGVMTKLKLDVYDTAMNPGEEELKQFSECRLVVEEAYCSDNNRRIYGVLPIESDEAVNENKAEGGDK